jgi:hypothetical protein
MFQLMIQQSAIALAFGAQVIDRPAFSGDFEPTSLLQHVPNRFMMLKM